MNCFCMERPSVARASAAVRVVGGSVRARVPTEVAREVETAGRETRGADGRH